MGARDLDNTAWRRRSAIRERLRTFLDRRGYDAVELPTLEQTDLFLRKSGGELAARMYSFTDPSGRSVSLRPEFTSSVVRAYVDGSLRGPLPLRLQYAGPVFRYEPSADGSGALERMWGTDGKKVVHLTNGIGECLWCNDVSQPPTCH